MRKGRRWRLRCSTLPDMTEVWQDLRYGVRMLRKSPGFFVVALLTLSIGIGATTAIFTFVDAWILTPLPYKNSNKLLYVQTVNSERGWKRRVSPADFLDWRSRATSFGAMVGWTLGSFNLTGVADPEKIRAAYVTPDFFSMLGIEPALGRAFLAEEGQTGKDHVVSTLR